MSKNPNVVGTLYKHPSETFDVSVDFSNWLTTGDTVASGTVTCYQGTTDVSSTLIGNVTDDDDDEVAFVLKAGTAGACYLITVTAATAQSDVWVAEIYLIVN
jgi:hypothetical protein